MSNSATHFLWCDLETTGLEPFKGDKMLEFAFKLTPAIDIEDLESGKSIPEIWSYQKAVHFSRSEAAALKYSSPFVYDMHANNGLLDECAVSDVTCDQVEIEVCRELDRLHGELGLKKNSVILAGSSIHFDRKWLEWFTPEICDRLHYRIMDVSSLYPVIAMLGIERVSRPKVHRAKDDIDRTIGELSDMLKLIRTSVGDNRPTV